jgi:MYXO-CTERM domain-containing protein
MTKYLRNQAVTVVSVLLAPLMARAATYYVATTGKDSAAGTEAAPWASMAHAQSVAAPGDTVYFRDGTYAYTSGLTSCGSSTSTVNAILFNKSGTSGNRINYWAYAGEKPVFDFSGIKDSCRVTGFQVQASWLYFKGLTLTGTPQNVNTNHESWAIYVNGGSNNIFELLDIHHNMGPGIFIKHGANNLVLNCDSHHNYDPNSGSASAPGGDAGGNADGFGCHIAAGDTGNVFRGCRAWWNSDDGWDFIQAQEVVTVENSWAWYNGYIADTMNTTANGNGNGFKAGGYDLVAADVPANPPKHVVQNCLSVSNKAAGFYENHHAAADCFYNNTSYNNHSDFNLLGVGSDGTSSLNLGFLRNNIAFGGTLLSNNTGSGVDSAYNTWDTSLGVTVTAADFQSVVITGLDGPRQADGTLPDIPNFHLAAGSKLIDKGTNVGLPYAGSAPDLGCFETGLAAGAGGGGGTSGSGGTTGSGGAPGTGGAPITGGASGSGGAAATGGKIGTGGALAGGGSTATGGRSGSGGAGGSGGSSAIGGNGGEAGGAVTTGGATGGFAGNGGASTTGPAGAGGSAATGGSQAGGATSGTTTTTGTPPANGGCSCHIATGQTTSSAGLVLCGLVMVALRRRKRR